MSKQEITTVKIGAQTYYTCNNCGASADTGQEIKHYPSCKPGESKRWQRYYEEAEDA